VLSTNTFMTCLGRRDFELGKEIRARSLRAPRPTLPDLLDQNIAPRCALPAAEHGRRPAVNMEISLTAGQSFALLQSLGGRTRLGVSTLLGPLVPLHR